MLQPARNDNLNLIFDYISDLENSFVQSVHSLVTMFLTGTICLIKYISGSTRSCVDTGIWNYLSFNWIRDQYNGGLQYGDAAGNFIMEQYTPPSDQCSGNFCAGTFCTAVFNKCFNAIFCKDGDEERSIACSVYYECLNRGVNGVERRFVKPVCPGGRPVIKSLTYPYRPASCWNAERHGETPLD